MSNVHYCPHCGIILSPVTESTSVLEAPDTLPLTVETPIPGTLCEDESNGVRNRVHESGSHEGEISEGPYGSPETQTFVHKFSDVQNASWVGSEEFDALAQPTGDPYLEALAGSTFPPIEASGSLQDVPARDSLNLVLDTKLHRPHELPTDSPEGPSSHRSWAMLLLASYASAVTISLGYILWTSKRGQQVYVDSMPRPARSGAMPNHGRTQALPADSITEIGHALVLGQLEVTPTRIAMESVELEHHGVHGRSRRERVGKGLVLRLDLKNLSRTESFFPVDREFVRNSDSRSAETVITSEARIIPAYPLANTSELAIVGQSFDIVEPGASIEARVVSDIAPDLSGVDFWTWWVKLRVSATETKLVGVRFSPSEIP